MIFSWSSLSKLKSSWLILSKYTLGMSISSPENITLPNRHLKNIIKSFVNKVLWSLLIVLIVASLSGANFNADRKLSKTLSYLCWAFYLPWQYSSIKGPFKTILSHAFWDFYWSGTESSTRGQVSTA